MSRPKLVGPGLAHLQVLTRLKPGADVTLVSEGRHHTYSGMLPGVVAGQHSLAEASLDLEALCSRSAARLEASGAVRLLIEDRCVLLGDGCRTTCSA